MVDVQTVDDLQLLPSIARLQVGEEALAASEATKVTVQTVAAQAVVHDKLSALKSYTAHSPLVGSAAVLADLAEVTVATTDSEVTAAQSEVLLEAVSTVVSAATEMEGTTVAAGEEEEGVERAVPGVVYPGVMVSLLVSMEVGAPATAVATTMVVSLLSMASSMASLVVLPMVSATVLEVLDTAGEDMETTVDGASRISSRPSSAPPSRLTILLRTPSTTRLTTSRSTAPAKPSSAQALASMAVLAVAMLLYNALTCLQTLAALSFLSSR